MPKSDNGALFDIPDYVPGLDVQPGVAHHGYRQAVAYGCGLTIMYDGATPTMGAHYIYSGQALNALRENGITTAEILEWHSWQGHKCTRIDLAVDVKGEHNFGFEFVMCGGMEKRHGTAKNVTVTRSLTDRGLTCYVGSRSSEIFCRIYDKGAEQKTFENWWRCEVEVKGKTAQLMADRVWAEGEASLKAITCAELERRAGFEFDEWTSMLSGLSQPLVISEVKTKQTRKWLLSTCVKALVRYEMENPGVDMLKEFTIAVEEMKKGRTSSTAE